MQRQLTCIVCPMGCSLNVELDGDKVLGVSGNTCPRGKVYAQNECTNPVRTVTTTVRTASGEILPVKTKQPIPKNQVKNAMKIINKAVAVLPIRVGDVIIEDVFGSPVVSAKSMGKWRKYAKG